MAKAMLLRVGIDRGCGGCLAPLFRDGSFEYIPIPEGKATSETRTYGSIIGRSGRPLSDFVSRKLANAAPHFDPDFDSFTYGDPTPKKRSQLLRLKRGEHLVFYAGLKPFEATDEVSRLFIIGVFEVSRVHDLGNPSQDRLSELLGRIGDNPHFLRSSPDKGLVVVQGDPIGSFLLDKAVPLGDARDDTIRDIHKAIGYEKSILRATGRWIEGAGHFDALQSWISEGPVSLIDSETRLFSYVVASDSGFAPNPFGGFCSLATCKPRIRKSAREGDWIVGMAPARIGSTKVVYAMRVNETLTFDEYFHDQRFACKKPTKKNHPGDNIYYRGPNGKFVQYSLSQRHRDTKSKARDTGTDRVLLGSLFWYFGKEPVDQPEGIADRIAHPYVGHKIIDDQRLIRSFVAWACSNYRIGVHGQPRKSSALKSSDQITSVGCGTCR